MEMLINNVDDFDKCGDCPCYDREWERCNVTLDAVQNPSIKWDEKNCPINKIAAPHGRLIDADKLLKRIEANDYLLRYGDTITERGMFTGGIKLAIDHARTIIKSSENAGITNASVKFELKSDQDAYDVIGDYIERFWKHNGIYEPLVVDLSKSYDDSDWVRSIELVEKNFNRWTTVFENDWWEGEKYLELHGIASLYDLEIEGGIFND